MSNSRVYKSVIVSQQARKILPEEHIEPEEEKSPLSLKEEIAKEVNKDMLLSSPTPPPDFQKERDEVITKARTEAQKITETAQKQAKDVEKKAYDKGFIAGKQQGIAEGQDLGKQEVKEIVEVFKRQLAALEKKHLTLVKDAESNVVRLVLEIAKKVIHQQIKEDKNIVIALVEEGIKRITEREKLIIRINKEDLEILKENREVLLSCADGIKSIEFQEDGRVESGGCIIETTVGTVDLRIESQLNVIAKAFVGMLEEEVGTVAK